MEKGGHEDVDYKTLRSFARRIGKHNIRAAREAEDDLIRQHQDAEERAAAASRPTANDNLPPVAMETTSEAGNIIPDNKRALAERDGGGCTYSTGHGVPGCGEVTLGDAGTAAVYP
jgi:hypothetical protein